MKKKYSRLGSSAASLLLSVVLAVTSTIVVSSNTVSTDFINTDTQQNNAAENTAPPEEAQISSAEDAPAAPAAALENAESERPSESQAPVLTLGNREKTLPARSGDTNTIYLLAPQSYDMLKIWSWNYGNDTHYTNSSETWPGTQITSVNSDGLYEINLDSRDDRIIFNKCNSYGSVAKQSGDIPINTSQGNVYSFYGNTGLHYGQTNRIYYKSPSGTPSIYAFTERKEGNNDSAQTVYQNAAFPGVQMTFLENGIYYADIPSYYEKVIFKVSDVQTADLEIQYTSSGTLSKNYYNESWSEYTPGTDGININDGKTYLLYRVNNYNQWTPRYAHFWNSSESLTTWPGMLLHSVEGYDNLYALDVTNFSTATKVQFSDGSGIGDKVENTERDYDYSAHQGEDLDFSYSSTTYKSNSVKSVYVANNQKNIFTDNNYNVHYVRRFDVRDFSDPLNETVTPADGQINVYAKSGTVRDHDHDYNKYSKLAQTEIWADGADQSDSKHGFPGYETLFYDGSSYRVKHAAAARGTKINITTTINDAYKLKYYVKAFVVNGKAYGIINEAQAHYDTGVYTYSYIVPNDTSVEAVEITPVYYYFEGNNSENYITFAVEDFAGRVREKWGNTISCFAWYEYGKDNTSSGENMAHALGGYPGQPMISEGGSFYMQVPKYIDGLGYIKGITLNNYIWDDVHGMTLRKYSDFNGLNNTVGDWNDDNRRMANAQTYDYDDFLALSDLPDVQEIIFSFKYRTFNNAGAEYGDENDGLGNQLSEQSNFGENGWNVLVDYDDHPVDLFGNRLTDSFPTESDVKSADNSQKLFVVSDGYINYYSYSSEPADQVNDKYLGEYATKWNVYTYDGNTYTLQGALPPSAFITTSDLSAYQKGSLSVNDNAAKEHFAHYLPKDSGNDIHSAAVTKLFGTYVNLFNQYKGVPVEITYESALNSDGRYKAASNPGYRNDGRWYYSRYSDSKIYANTKIYILQDNSASGNNIFEYEGKKYLLDEYIPGKNKGAITGAVACFDNSELGKPHYGQTSLTNVDKDSSDYFQLRADSVSTVNEGNTTYNYVFQGWFLDTGGEVLNPITENTKAYRRMSSFATFVAVYSKETVDPADTKLLHVDHKLYAEQTLDPSDPAAHTGTGSTYVESVTVRDSADNVLAIVTGNEVDSLEINIASYPDADKVTVNIRTLPDAGFELTSLYQYSENAGQNQSKYLAKDTQGASNTSMGTILSYDYTVTELFGSQGSEKAFAKIELFSDLKPVVVTKDIQLEFKFYDRDVQNNRAATIKSEPTTLHYTLTDITDYDSLKAKLGSFVGTKSDEGITFIGDLTNVIDDYVIWTTQTEAIDASAGLGDRVYHKDDVLVNGVINYGAENYKNVPDYDQKCAYHTDYLGNLQSGQDAEKWITYYDNNNTPIGFAGTNDTVEGKTVYKDNVDPQTTNLTRIVLWAFNEPKQYTLTVCSDKRLQLEGEEEPSYHGTLKPANQGNGDDALYFFGDEETITFADNTAIAPTYKGFYNQRVGAADEMSATLENGADGAADYLVRYFGRTGEGDVTTDIAYTGEVVEAPASAPYVYTDQNSEEVKETYYFDGWYIKAHNGKYVKVSSDRIYGNRITSDLTLYSMYKKTNSYASASEIGGAAATGNGTDVYIDANNTKNVRLNTQLNVYYNGKNIDMDSNIKQVSVVYVSLNDLEAADNESIAAAGDKAKAWIEYNKSFLTQSGKVRKSGTVALYSGDTNGHTVIMDTFQNDSNAGSSLQITLTSKNRLQFVLPMTSELYDGTYSNLIAFVAIQYKNGETPEWYVSDNYVSYVHG